MCPLSQPYPDPIFRLASSLDMPNEIPELLNALLTGIQTALDDNLCAVYLRGSLAAGDFDPQTSDIDFFVVTKHQSGEAEFATLAAMHNQLAMLPNRYALHLEGTYINHASVRRTF